MLAAVIGLALVVAVLTVLVAGLLRSHAEILRALHDRGIDLDPARDELPFPQARPGLAPVDGPGAFPDAADIAGQSPHDDALVVGMSGPDTHVVLAFLSSQCLTCREIWRAIEPRLPFGAEVVAVTKGPAEEVPAEVARLAPDDLTVVMSSEAWQAYEVPVSPYFVHVLGGRVVGTGAAGSWDQVRGLVETAMKGGLRAPASTGAQGGRVDPRPAQDRADQVDAALAAAGIHPGDPRLWPSDGTVLGP